MKLKRNKKDKTAQWELVNNAMTTTLAAGCKILQDEFGFSDLDSGMWVLKTGILLNDNLGIDTSELNKMLAGLAND